MDDREFMDELSLPQRESMLRLVKELDRIEENRKNGDPGIPVEEVIAEMKAIVEARRREQKHG